MALKHQYFQVGQNLNYSSTQPLNNSQQFLKSANIQKPKLSARQPLNISNNLFSTNNLNTNLTSGLNLNLSNGGIGTGLNNALNNSAKNNIGLNGDLSKNNAFNTGILNSNFNNSNSNLLTSNSKPVAPVQPLVYSFGQLNYNPRKSLWSPDKKKKEDTIADILG